jgi:hypothetical protein
MTFRVRMAPWTPRKPLSINFAVSGFLNDKFQTRNDEEQSIPTARKCLVDPGRFNLNKGQRE